MIVRDSAGTEILEIGDAVAVGGYTGTLYQDGDRVFRRTTVKSPVVDDEFETQAVLAAKRVTLEVLIEGVSWSEITARRAVLLDAAEASSWQLQVGAVTWACRAADSTSPIPPEGTASTYRLVSLSIPVAQQRGI